MWYPGLRVSEDTLTKNLVEALWRCGNSNVTISHRHQKWVITREHYLRLCEAGAHHSARAHDIAVPYGLSLPPDGQHAHNFLPAAQCTQVVLRGRHADHRGYRVGQAALPHLLQQPLWLLSR